MQFRFKSCGLPLAGLMLIGAVAPAANAQSRNAQSRAAQSVAGELLVRWKAQPAPLILAPTTDPGRWQQSALKSQLSARLPGSNVKKTFAASGWTLVKIPAGQSTETARAALIKTLGAGNVALNGIRHVARVPNDPSYSSQWQWPKIGAPDAWNNGAGTREVVVAVLDSGIDLNHADLKANLWTNTREIGGNGIDDDGNGYVDDVYGLNAVSPGAKPQDDFGHGTHCAGLIGAVGNNGTDVTGINWAVKIMALKFIGSDGDGTDDDAISCFEYAIKMKQSGVNLKVISNSYAGTLDNPALASAYYAAEDAGILQVSAAGNGGGDNDAVPQYPASYSSNSSISVASSDSSDRLAATSNYGAQSVDLAAPGESILSLKLGGGTTYMSGTSMATPIVAGAAALISSLEPNLSASALKARLVSTVDKVAALNGLVASGGRLNLARGVTPISYALSGQVYYLKNGARVSLPTAKVVLSGKTAGTVTTDNNGKYLFSTLAPGTYTVTVTLKGYTFSAATQTFPLASGATGATLDFQATSVPSVYYTLFGVARDSLGAPVKGVSIYLNTALTTPLAVTDSNGKYSIPNLPQNTYTLKAIGGGDYKWYTTPNSVAVPEGAINGKAEVNFLGVLNDKIAPAITITSPAEGGVFAPGNQLALGTASDASGNKEIYLELSRYLNSTRTYYNWVTRQWFESASAGTTLTRAASGKNTKWSATLPGMAPANYSLRVWGKDTRGNVSRGEADAFSSFSVVKSSSSARSSAGSS